MKSITTIENISKLILVLINAGSVARIIYCAIMLNNPDCEHQMKKRILHTLIFLAIANSIFTAKAVIQSYWG